MSTSRLFYVKIQTLAFNSVGLVHLILKNPPTTSQSLYNISGLLDTSNKDPEVLLGDAMGAELQSWGLEVKHIPEWLKTRSFRPAMMEEVFQAVQGKTDRLGSLTKEQLVLLKGYKEGLLRVVTKLENGNLNDMRKLHRSLNRVGTVSYDWVKTWGTRRDNHPFLDLDL
jgi:hypothetical protein